MREVVKRGTTYGPTVCCASIAKVNKIDENDNNRYACLYE